MKIEKKFNCEKCGNFIVFEYETTHYFNIGSCEKCKEEFAFDDEEKLFFASIQRELSDYEQIIECVVCGKEFGVVEQLDSKCPFCKEAFFWCIDEMMATYPVSHIRFENGKWATVKYN
jgi:phage FluMu protein Com